MTFVLMASGTPTTPALDINLYPTDEDTAKLEAGKIAKRLHLAGYYRFEVMRTTGEVVDGVEQYASVINFRTETEEPSIHLGK